VTPHLSFHSDLPMAPSSPLYLAWTAVNRITVSGRVAAPDQRVSVDAAMRAITIESAYSWRQENLIGSIKPGKIANLTVLEGDPYKVDPGKLKDIVVWGTMFEGKVYPVPEANRSKVGFSVVEPPTAVASAPHRRPPWAAHDHGPGEEPCHLSDLSRMAVQAYTTNIGPK